jgi:hypothetical protein
VVPSTDYIGIFHTKWSIVASETGLSEVEVGLSATIGPNPSRPPEAVVVPRALPRGRRCSLVSCVALELCCTFCQ